MEVDGDEAGVGRRTSADDCLHGFLRRSLLSTRLRQLEESVSLMVRHSVLNVRYISLDSLIQLSARPTIFLLHAF